MNDQSGLKSRKLEKAEKAQEAQEAENSLQLIYLFKNQTPKKSSTM